MYGQRIKELRSRSELTQQELAKELGLTPKAISFYENEQREPSIQIILKLAKRFSVSTDFLLGNLVKQNQNYISLLTEEENNLVQTYRKLSTPNKTECKEYMRYKLSSQTVKNGDTASKVG